jgi:hypothetical protein
MQNRDTVRGVKATGAMREAMPKRVPTSFHRNPAAAPNNRPGEEE